jgi:hypothetical protein
VFPGQHHIHGQSGLIAGNRKAWWWQVYRCW